MPSFKVKKKAFYEGSMLYPGDEFEADEGFSATWAVPAAEFKPEPVEDEKVLAEKAVEGLQGKKTTKKKVSKKSRKKAKKKG